ncbi:MAG: carbon monoxide dehydrogenase [Rhodospirillaceae bacterium]|nr:carbon monoxide dehydrogenase [Rhodospirillaceae bacterium]
MKIQGRYLVCAERDQVWAALNDERVLSRCIPGVKTLEKISNTEFAATVTTKVGPVKATFSGEVTLSDLDPPNGYKISGEGQGGVAGFAKGTCLVRLTEAQAQTDLRYEAEAQVGGKLAQIGSRMVVGVAKKTADQFFEAFKVEVEGKIFQAGEGPDKDRVNTGLEGVAESSGRGLSPGVWIGGVIVIVVLAWWLSS